MATRGAKGREKGRDELASAYCATIGILRAIDLETCEHFQVWQYYRVLEKFTYHLKGISLCTCGLCGAVWGCSISFFCSMH